MIINPDFFIGTVVNNVDPQGLHRVRVKIFGEHDELSQGDDQLLPWSTVMLPTTNAGTGGNSTSIGLTVNSTVFGLYINESDTLILGCIQSSNVPTPMSTVNSAEVWGGEGTNPGRKTAGDGDAILPKKVMTRSELTDLAIDRRARLVKKLGPVEGNLRANKMDDARYHEKNNTPPAIEKKDVIPPKKSKYDRGKGRGSRGLR